MHVTPRHTVTARQSAHHNTREVNPRSAAPTLDSLQPPSSAEEGGHLFSSFELPRWLTSEVAKAFVSLTVTTLLLGGLTYYFYTYIHQTRHQAAILNGLFFTLTIDGWFLLVNLVRSKKPHRTLTCDPRKLTILIICYNGEKIISETIRQALLQVPPRQIIVVSDASTDRTVSIARSFGVRVFSNLRNINKGLSINAAIAYVTTPYVLILDDDTLIGQTRIPTNLLDDGWAAVAFKVLPEPTASWANQFQRFEYSKTMTLAKAARRSVGAVSNVSGALGLFHTKYLYQQSLHHSGQSGGEDQQRTLFTHLQNSGKGVTYVDEVAYTKAPDTWRALFRQRAFKWNRSTQENFFLCWYILANPYVPALLKVEKALQLFILLTDPLRVVWGWVIFTRPDNLLALYLCYVILNGIAWRNSERNASLWVVFLAPVYSFFKMFCRFVAHLYWFKVKYDYVVRHRYHHFVPNRPLVFEYATVMVVLVVLWGLAFERLWHYAI